MDRNREFSDLRRFRERLQQVSADPEVVLVNEVAVAFPYNSPLLS